jgi:KDO2-lipid IV(A) lauroyltransferase
MDVAEASGAPSDRDGAGGGATGLNLLQRGALRAMVALLHAVQRLPDRPILRLAHALGAGLYLVMPARRALVRANLARTCEWLAKEGLASPRVAAAASDPRRLDAMARSAFGHWMVSHVESALVPRYSREDLLARVVRNDPVTAVEALAAPAPGRVGQIHMAMHFGSLDLAVLYGARVGTQPLTGPMEDVANPLARAYFEHVRGQLDATVVPLTGAAKSLTEALHRGESVGVVADRLIIGRGSPVEFFGSPVRLPIGPAVLAVQTGATIYLDAFQRTGAGAWRAFTVAIRAEGGLTRRQAVRAILEQEVRAFERIIARAPEQWTTVLFPIWDDIDGSDT